MTSEDTIPLFARRLDELDIGDNAYLTYRSNRGADEPKTHTGDITVTDIASADRASFEFYDEQAERLIRVELENDIENSRVRSKKTTTWTTIGNPVLVAIDDTDAEQAYLLDKRNEEYDSIVAVAAIKRYERILQTLR